ncbi:pyridoxal phosphate-dependent aminotransferase [Amycolatopsis sp. CA-230715]|uniref:pyridoxal phosphate-dependent aminotransferase n=1 Tax=Amycolatopsis sp. CA-230715 TaxID=2745196 RepID=UPI001C3430A4|nr:aminotransferase class I/II-fold pyridoxal phosphate-dependent enzyme [Amycolatopsis sp. CA-230715]QWF85106.1 LL-diaminopimelate aminotransferase [Amycolatopsis sp. CA-230715]
MTAVFATSPNLALDEAVNRLRAEGRSLVHLGFGESQLPVPDFLVARLSAGAQRNAYGPIAGAEDAREAAAGYFTRRGLATGPEQTVLAPGSKPILFALMAALEGSVILPKPCWVTYEPQARLAGRGVLEVPIPAESGGVPDPERLPEAIRAHRAAGGDPRILLLTLPDNPTGTYPSRETVRRLCEIAEEEDLLIISDEIYRDILHEDGASVTSPAEFVPDRTVVTSGLSKSLALGGWRIGFARFPDTGKGRWLRSRVLGVGSEIWSTLAGPMQEVAVHALSEPDEVVAHLSASVRLHGSVAAAVHAIVTEAGAVCRRPTGGFYVYPDFEQARAVLAAKSVTDSASLQEYLIERLGVAVLGGHHLGDVPRCLRFRAATSMLYGETPAERWAALRAPDPVALPHVAAQLDTLRDAFARLTE